MKPEQRAHIAWQLFVKRVDLLEIQVAFERAIYEAVLFERERCATIAESFIPSGFPGHVGVARDDRARVIATAIRGAKKENTDAP